MLPDSPGAKRSADRCFENICRSTWNKCSQLSHQTAGDGMGSRISPRWTGWHQSHVCSSSITMTAGWPVSAKDRTLTVPGWHPIPRLIAGGYSIHLDATHPRANCLSVCIEANVIDGEADILLELTTMWDSRRASLMQERGTLTRPERFTYITTISNHLRETSWKNKAPWSNNEAFHSDFSERSKKQNLSLMPFLSFISSPLAPRLLSSNTTSSFLLHWPYSPPAPVCYPCHMKYPISLRIPNWFGQSLSSDLWQIGLHDLFRRGLSIPVETVAARQPLKHPLDQL